MPEPVYVVAAQFTSIDSDTGLMSLTSLVEKIVRTPIAVPEHETRPIFIEVHPLRLVAVWMRSTDDSAEQEFEHQLMVLMPNSLPGAIAMGNFRFEKDFHRFMTTINPQRLQIGSSGTMWLESRVRRVGTEEWKTQRCPILVEQQEVSERADQEGPRPPEPAGKNGT